MRPTRCVGTLHAEHCILTPVLALARLVRIERTFQERRNTMVQGRLCPSLQIMGDWGQRLASAVCVLGMLGGWGLAVAGLLQHFIVPVAEDDFQALKSRCVWRVARSP